MRHRGSCPLPRYCPSRHLGAVIFPVGRTAEFATTERTHPFPRRTKSSAMMHASCLRTPVVASNAQLRRRGLTNLTWSRLRRNPIRALVGRLIAFARGPQNRKPAGARCTSLRVFASAMAVDPLSDQDMSKKESSSDSNPSDLSNGPLPETLILGELLGCGTFGEVYRAYDSVAGREVAVKIVSKTRQGSDPASMEAVKQRIEHEVSMWCELQSFSSAVRLERFYEDAERVYFVQELCNGGSLEDLMKLRGRLSEAEVAQVMQTVLSLAAFCHERQIAYCDIKPANFILPSTVPGLNALHNSSDFVKVIDFGSCEHVPKNGLRGEKGTPLYMAPEVHHSRYNVESDVWSAGILMYYLLSGENPFVGKPSRDLTPSALSFYLQFGELKFDPSLWKNVSDDAKNLISRLLERNVKKRVRAADALGHPWMQRLVSNRTASNTPPATLSDICPMDSHVRVLEQSQ